MRYLIFGLLLSASALANPGHFFKDKERQYTRSLFATQKECEEAQKMGINCFQSVEFFPDGKVLLMVTDIMNIGTYQIQGQKALLEMQAGEVPRRISYSIATDYKSLTLDANGTVWLLKEE